MRRSRQADLLDTVILDTAGRLHIAEMPMDELKQIDRLVKRTTCFWFAMP